MDRIEPQPGTSTGPAAETSGQACGSPLVTPRLARLRELAKGGLATAAADAAAVRDDPHEAEYQALLDSVTDWDSFDQRSV